MAVKFFNRLIKWCARERFLFVLVSFLGFLVLSPLFKSFIGLKTFLDIFLTVIFISAIYAVSQKRHNLIIGTLLITPMFLATWISHFVESPALSLIATVSGILFFAFMVVTILSFVLKQTKITPNVIYAAIVVYFSIAMMWGLIFILVEILQSGSINLVNSQVEGNTFQFFYYSFVTITTLGYGDISPTSDIARSLALLEAVIGQIYLVVLVARLVGIHIAQSMKE